MASLFRRAGNLISNLLKLQPKKTFVGSDLEGNKYFEILPQTYLWGLKQNDKLIRIVEPHTISRNPIPEPVKVTIEWEAWLRKKRDDPPTMEELVKNIEQHNLLQDRIKAVDEKLIKPPISPATKKFSDPRLSQTKQEKESQTVDSWSADKA